MYVYDNMLLNSSRNENVSEQIWEIFKTHILLSVTFCPGKSWLLWDNVERYAIDRTRKYHMAHVHRMLDK